MNRPSLYGAFGDKRELYIKSYRRYREDARAAMGDTFATELPIRKRLQRIYAVALDIYLSGETGPRGCFTVMTAASEAVHDPDIRAMVLEGFVELDKAFAACFRQRQGEGRIAGDADPAVLAQLASATIHTIASAPAPGVPRKELEAIVKGAIDVMRARRITLRNPPYKSGASRGLSSVIGARRSNPCPRWNGLLRSTRNDGANTPARDPPHSPAHRRPRSARSARATYFEISSGSVSAALCGVSTTFGMGPERTVRRQRLGARRRRARRRRACRRRGSCRMSASFCRPPRPALISTGAPSGLLRLSFSNSARLRMCRVSGVSGSRQTRMSVCRRNASSCCFAVKAFDAGDRPRAAAPAGDAKAEALQRVGRIGAQRAQPHDADRDRARRPLRISAPSVSRAATPADKAPAGDASAHAARHIRSSAR